MRKHHSEENYHGASQQESNKRLIKFLLLFMTAMFAVI
jgi:hypothetical protein